MSDEGIFRPGATRLPGHIFQAWRDEEGGLFLQQPVQWRLNAALNDDSSDPDGTIISGWRYLSLSDSYDSLSARIRVGSDDTQRTTSGPPAPPYDSPSQLIRVRPPFVADGYHDVGLPPRPWFFAWRAANQHWTDFPKPVVVELTAAFKSRPIPARVQLFFHGLRFILVNLLALTLPHGRATLYGADGTEVPAHLFPEGRTATDVALRSLGDRDPWFAATLDPVRLSLEERVARSCGEAYRGSTEGYILFLRLRQLLPSLVTAPEEYFLPDGSWDHDTMNIDEEMLWLQRLVYAALAGNPIPGERYFDHELLITERYGLASPEDFLHLSGHSITDFRVVSSRASSISAPSTPTSDTSLAVTSADVGLPTPSQRRTLGPPAPGSFIDFICQECGHHNFGWRRRCRACHASRPSDREAAWIIFPPQAP